jgi:hypothetical protein
MSLIDQIVYSGTLALLAFIPAAISQMIIFYKKERYRPTGKSEMKWFRRFTLLMTASLWVILFTNLTALVELTTLPKINKEIGLSSISVFLLTSSLVMIVLSYSIYIILFFNRLDWNNKHLTRFSGPSND